MKKRSRIDVLSDKQSDQSSFHLFNRAIIGFLHVVCPLLFFTNLTRNPYYTQIALLNIGIAVVIFSVVGRFVIQRRWMPVSVPIRLSLGVFLIWAFFSTVFSWINHPALRPGITFESTRVWIFTLVNCVFAFLLPLLFTKPFSSERKPLNMWVDLTLAALWACLWVGFHSMKDPHPLRTFWDPYGAVLWAGAIAYAVWRSSSGRMEGVFHIIFSVAVVAGLYGISQYAGRDFIWAGTVTPYGGRPVSSFGNPNFLSSYVMMVVPISIAFSFQAQQGYRSAYAVVALISTLSTLSTLTRSSYVGLLASFIIFASLAFREIPGLFRKTGIGLCVVVGLIVVFPKTPVISTQSPAARFTEILDAKKSGSTYAPWHQRLLIWSSALDMVKERPFLGKGWGCFELFYPFYQGRYLLDDRFAPLRTHANNAHNILLELMSQIGLIGTGISIWILIAILWFGLSRLRAQADSRKKIVMAGLIAAIVGMVVDNFFGNVSIFFAVPAFMFWWVVGVLFREGEHQIGSVEPRPLNMWSSTGFILTGLICVVSIVYFVQRWNQERYYFDGFKFSRVDRVAESIQALEKAFRWFPGEVNGNYELGNSYARKSRLALDQKRPEEAKSMMEKSMQAYEWALKANPGYDEIYFNLGITQLQNGLTAQGIKSLETAVLINPLLQSAYNSLGSFYLQNSKFSEAVQLYEQGTRAFPKEKDYWNNLGYAYAQTNNQEKAYESFSRALEIDPSFENARINLLTTAQKIGKGMPQVPSVQKNR